MTLSIRYLVRGNTGQLRTASGAVYSVSGTICDVLYAGGEGLSADPSLAAPMFWTGATSDRLPLVECNPPPRVFWDCRSIGDQAAPLGGSLPREWPES